MLDRIVSTIILVAVSITLAVALSSYYAGFVKLFMGYEEISFDYAYASIRDGQAEIVVFIRFIKLSIDFVGVESVGVG